MRSLAEHGWPLLLTALLATLAAWGLDLFLALFSDKPDLVLDLRTLAVTGGLGGVISGFIRNERRLILCAYPSNGTRHIECGSLADAAIGLGGAWGVFFVLGRSMRIGTNVEDLLTLVGLGVVAGFSARALLATLRERVLGEARSVAIETAKETVKARAEQTESYSDASAVAVLVQVSDTLAGPEPKTQLLKNAEGRANELIARDPNDAGALILLGNVKKRLALLADAPAERNRLIDEAIGLSTRVVELRPTAYAGYYNRACYKALRGAAIGAILPDIDKAIELSPEAKALLQQDPDLAGVRNAPDLLTRLR